MTSSRWHAHGNVYLVSDDDALTPERVREQARDTDGILQVLRVDGDDGRDRDLEPGRLDARRCRATGRGSPAHG